MKLKNGGPIHFYDSNFRFGVRNAQMLIACLDVLREFWQSTEGEGLTFKTRLIEDRRQGLRVLIAVKMHPDFEYSTGQTVDRPWLQLKALPPDTEHLGLGMMKSRAICAVKEELKSWLKSKGVHH